LKYEQLYRHDIGDGQALAGQVESYLDTYNRIRPHEAIELAGVALDVDPPDSEQGQIMVGAPGR